MQNFFSALTPSGIVLVVIGLFVIFGILSVTIYNISQKLRKQGGKQIRWYDQPTVILGMSLSTNMFFVVLNRIMVALISLHYISSSIGSIITSISIILAMVSIAIAVYMVYIRKL